MFQTAGEKEIIVSTVHIPTWDQNLNRLDNSTWSFQRNPGSLAQDTKLSQKQIHEVRIQTPEFSMPGQAYTLALTVAQALQSNEIFNRLKKNNSLLFES